MMFRYGEMREDSGVDTMKGCCRVLEFRRGRMLRLSFWRPDLFGVYLSGEDEPVHVIDSCAAPTGRMTPVVPE